MDHNTYMTLIIFKAQNFILFWKHKFMSGNCNFGM